MSGDFVTWNSIMSYAGAVTLTTIMTQFFKQIPGINKVNSQLLAFIIAVLLLETATVFSGGWAFETAVLSLVNGVVVALASNGTYDAISTKSAAPALKEGENNG